MKKLNVLSREEMKKVMGGLFPIQVMFENCLADIGSNDGSEEYGILYSFCLNQAENFCAREIAMGRPCDLMV